ncbi:MAG: prephenate dehydrogenase [Actinomycetota bacterium]|nr:prephenate dehydrogenase [Actinomycetota bacterium]
MTSLGRVAIVGAGQMGTMLGMALLESAEEVALADADQEAVETSLVRGAGQRRIDVDEAVDSDAVILAVPVPEIVSLIERLGPNLREEALLIDTGGAKVAVVEAMRRHVPEGVHAIGGHPMAGTEIPGPEGADPLLLRHATFALTEVREDPIALLRATTLAEATGARPRVMDAVEHDLVVARTSHLPHVVAYALAGLVRRLHDESVRDLATSGFEGATRLAASDPAMVAGFLRANSDQVRDSIRELRERLEKLEGALGDRDALARLLEEDAEGLGKAGA